jgi:hypothetical protein
MIMVCGIPDCWEKIQEGFCTTRGTELYAVDLKPSVRFRFRGEVPAVLSSGKPISARILGIIGTKLLAENWWTTVFQHISTDDATILGT